MRWTPGPWHVEYNDTADFKAYEVVGPNNNEWVCECGYGGNSEACAAFIAAAPEMYEALKNSLKVSRALYGALRQAGGEIMPTVEAVNEASAAVLAKAEGKEL